MMNATREKTRLWLLILVGVVATLLGQTHAREIFTPSPPESGIFAEQTQASTGESYDGIQYDALDSLLAAKTPLWSSTKSKSSVENAFGHWEKHGKEFSQFQNSKQYVEGAKSFFSSPPPGTLSKVRSNGENVFYNPANNTFGVQAVDGAPKTMFKPDPAKHGYKSNLDYFNAQ